MAAPFEVGTVGREGVSAIPLLLGATTSANESYCQVPGHAVVVDSDHFRRWLRTENGRFRSVVLDRFLQAYVSMLGQLAACNGKHSIYERCARRPLMHYCVNSDKIAWSHEYLSMMLGARRSGVTIAAAALQRAGFIRDAYGDIRNYPSSGLRKGVV